MMLWFKIGLEFLYRQRSNDERVRQRLALFLSSALLFWPLFDRSQESWTWRLNVVVPLSLMGRLIYKASLKLLRVKAVDAVPKLTRFSLLFLCCSIIFEIRVPFSKIQKTWKSNVSRDLEHCHLNFY